MNTGSAEFNSLENPDAETEMEVFGELKDGSRAWVVRSAGNTSVRQLRIEPEGKDRRRF